MSMPADRDPEGDSAAPAQGGLLTAARLAQFWELIRFSWVGALTLTIYAAELCRELGARHLVTLLCAEYDPSRAHGHLTWREHDGLPVVELVNNWMAASLADTYASPLLTARWP